MALIEETTAFREAADFSLAGPGASSLIMTFKYPASGKQEKILSLIANTVTISGGLRPLRYPPQWPTGTGSEGKGARRNEEGD